MKCCKSINTDIYQPGNDVDGGEGDVIVNDVDQHQGQEADQEGDEDGQHHLCQPEILYRQQFRLLNLNFQSQLNI